ncbi:MAG: hypothetical protein PHF20_04510 [Halothiobacillaceae bacterium]|nr:hypothetical protein [Halothiobacillaceae bacterium]HES75679.1 hypothetical protein [bacterium]
MSSGLHDSILDLIAIAARVASNHPGGDVCLMERLSAQGVPAEHIAQAIQLARNVRDEANSLFDARVDARMLEKLGTTPDQASLPGKGCCGASACCN